MSARKDDLTRQRLAKLHGLRARGIDPYPPRYHPTHSTKQAAFLFEQEEQTNPPQTLEVTIAGRIVGQRGMGRVAFLDVRDGSGKIQVHLHRDLLGEEKYGLLKDCDVGDFIGVRGKVFRTKTGETTIEASEFTLLAKSLQPLPEKWHGLVDVEKRYRQRHLDLLSSEGTRRIFTVRSRVIATVRRFLDERGFLEAETPVLLPVAAGAMARPFVTHHHALDRDLYLRIATELHLKRLVIGGLDRVYEIGRIFRNEGISTRHNPEFTTLESYQAYADYHDVARMVEEMVACVAQEAVGSARVTFAGTTVDLTPPWRRVALREELLETCGVDFLAEETRDPEALRTRMRQMGVEAEADLSWGRLVDKLVSAYVEPRLVQPTFVLDYPVEMSPLAKTKPGEPRLVERFEAFAGGMEIANAFTELNDPLEQRERFDQQEALRQRYGDEEVDRRDEDFLQALEYGMPPTGGLGVGIDRLVMLLTDQQSIREVILFPQMRER